jgi:hypothetical protein
MRIRRFDAASSTLVHPIPSLQHAICATVLLLLLIYHTKFNFNPPEIEAISIV